MGYLEAAQNGFGDVVSYRNPDPRFSNAKEGRIFSIIYECQEGSEPYITYWVQPIGEKFIERTWETEIFGKVLK